LNVKVPTLPGKTSLNREGPIGNGPIGNGERERAVTHSIAKRYVEVRRIEHSAL
jgi:hypothetical protein